MPMKDLSRADIWHFRLPILNQKHPFEILKRS